MMTRAAVSIGFLVLGLSHGTQAADRYVSPSGVNDLNACLSAATPCATVSHAAGQSQAGDTINVAGGRYTDNVRLDTTTTLQFLGGWSPDFATRDPLGTPSVMTGGRVNVGGAKRRERVWGIFAEGGESITVTIDGFVLRKGRAATSIPDIGIPLVAEGRAGGGLTAFAIEDSTISLTVQNTTVERNRDGYGGAGLSLWAIDGSSLDAVLDDVRIVQNRTTIPGAGGGVAAFSGLYLGPAGTVTLTLRNCLVAKNDGGFGGGGILATGINSASAVMTVDIISSTISENIAHGPPMASPPQRFGGGGVGAVSGGGPTTIRLLDSILYGNRLKGDAVGADFYDFYPPPSMVTLSADHSDLGDIVLEDGPLDDLGGNVSVDAGLTRGYALEATSPLIDAGTCTGAPAVDIDGDPRPTGAGCDIGADEFVP